MKSKKEFVMLILVIAVLVLYLIFHKTDQTHYALPEVPGISNTEITKIEISGPNKVTSLSKKDAQWVVGSQEYPADTDKVKKILDVISGLTLTDLVSASENYARYDLTKDQKTVVKVWTGDTPALEFEMGKTAASRNHTFIKLTDDANVYQASGNFRQKLDTTVAVLRDKTVLAFTPDEIHEIEITKSGKTIKLTKKEVPVESEKKEDKKEVPAAKKSPKTKTLWESEVGEKADNDAVNDLLSELSGLACENFINDKGKNDYTGPFFTITLSGGQKPYVLSVFKKADEQDNHYPAVSSENQYPFKLSEYRADKIIKNPGALLKKEE